MLKTLIAITLIAGTLTPSYAGKEYNGDRGSFRNGKGFSPGKYGHGKHKPNKPCKASKCGPYTFPPTPWDDMNYMAFINKDGQFDVGWFDGGGVTDRPLTLVGRPDQPAGIQPCHCYAPPGWGY